MTTNSSVAPPLSVVVTTTHPWPSAQGCLDRLCPQATAVGAELILVDSTGRGLPDPRPQSYSNVRWLHVPGASVFELRARAAAAATGAIVGFTEDHCRPSRDFVRLHIQAHQRHSGAMVVGGAVLNGSPGSLLDWASYLLTFGPFLPPIRPGRMRRAATGANVSFKRHAVNAHVAETGWIEFVLQPRLLAAGQVVFDDAILVRHLQSKGPGTFALHFHSGRSAAGLTAAGSTLPLRILRLGWSLTLPLRMLASACPGPLANPAYRWRALRSLPWMAALAVCHSAGVFSGLLLKGAGRSPHLLE